VLARDNRGTCHAVYVAKVRITVRADGSNVVREGHGTGEAQGDRAGEAHERALKMAETDATKRALATFGKPFGLALYMSGRNGRDQRSVHNPVNSPPIANEDRRRTQQHLGAGGRFYVPARHRAVLQPALARLQRVRPTQFEETAAESMERGAAGSPAGAPTADSQAAGEPNAGPNTTDRTPDGVAARDPRTEEHTGDARPTNVGAAADVTKDHPATVSPPLQPPETPSRAPDRVQPIERPTRHREPAHLRFVMTQPCLLCGRTPSDAHHLRFAQPRALGRKVSDEFTVPLCRTHHRQAHQTGNEAKWWQAMDRDVDPLEIAKGLWDEFHNRGASSSISTSENTPSTASSREQGKG